MFGVEPCCKIMVSSDQLWSEPDELSGCGGCPAKLFGCGGWPMKMFGCGGCPMKLFGCGGFPIKMFGCGGCPIKLFGCGGCPMKLFGFGEGGWFYQMAGWIGKEIMQEWRTCRVVAISPDYWELQDL